MVCLLIQVVEYFFLWLKSVWLVGLLDDYFSISELFLSYHVLFVANFY
jgi:hypothetical protein